jgi:hypothetical protein
MRLQLRRKMNNRLERPGKNVVIIEAKNTREGIRKEYAYIESECLSEGLAYEVLTQKMIMEGERIYDLIQIALQNGRKRDYWFDITGFFGRS